MITEDFVIIPLEVRGIVPYGIGSVRIDRRGRMEFIAPSGDSFGKEMEEKFRAGELKALMLTATKAQCNLKSLKNDQPCVLDMGHRFEGMGHCISQEEMDDSEK